VKSTSAAKARSARLDLGGNQEWILECVPPPRPASRCALRAGGLPPKRPRPGRRGRKSYAALAT
jgi:hypothetical protein